MDRDFIFNFLCRKYCQFSLISFQKLEIKYLQNFCLDEQQKTKLFSFVSIFLSYLQCLLCLRLSNHLNSHQKFVYEKIKYDGRKKPSSTNIKKAQKNHNNQHEVLRVKLYRDQIG